MCRRNLIPAGVLIGFGMGILLCFLVEAVLVRLALAGLAIAAGMCLLKMI